ATLFPYTTLFRSLGEAQHAGLGGRVVGLARLTLDAIDRRDVDDATPAALGHLRRDVVGDVEQAVQIGVDHRIPLALLHLGEELVAGNAGVVHQHIDRTDVGFDLGDHRRARLVVRHVAFGGGEVEAEVALGGQPGVL